MNENFTNQYNSNNISTNFKRRGTTLISNLNFQETSIMEDKLILDYKEKFRVTGSEIKSSLQNIKGNIKNYTNEISRLEDFLSMINQHENNYKNIIQRFNNLKKKLEETIQMEIIIKNLSSNQ